MARISKWLKELLLRERCARRIALSVSLSIFIAFSPMIGFHTIMVFLFAWLFSLSPALIFAVSSGIHNPWTMIPIYATDHVVGDWLFKCLGISAQGCDPACLNFVSDFVARHIGIQGLSLSAFLVGGNLLALALSVILYPLVRHTATRFLQKRTIVPPSSVTEKTSDENCCSE